jgi:hypothetical protein
MWNFRAKGANYFAEISSRGPEGGTGQHSQLQDDRHGKAAKDVFSLHRILVSTFRFYGERTR